MLVAEERFDTADRFRASLSPDEDRWGEESHEWIFRGQANADWPLLASAFRPDVVLSPADPEVLGPRETYQDQVAAEGDVLLSFLEIADRGGLALPVPDSSWADTYDLGQQIRQAMAGGLDWPFPEIAPLMALAQHHGLPTRLLDWSRRGLRAAYFAAIGAVSKPGSAGENLVVWAFHPRRARILNTRPPWRFRLVRAPGGSNSFLQAQAGVFTLAGHSKRRRDQDPVPPPLEDIVPLQAASLREAGRKLPEHPVLWKLELPRVEAGKLLGLLSRDWVDGASLFPGYAGAAQAVRERRWQS